MSLALQSENAVFLSQSSLPPQLDNVELPTNSTALAPSQALPMAQQRPAFAQPRLAPPHTYSTQSLLTALTALAMISLAQTVLVRSATAASLRPLPTQPFLRPPQLAMPQAPQLSNAHARTLLTQAHLCATALERLETLSPQETASPSTRLNAHASIRL